MTRPRALAGVAALLAMNGRAHALRHRGRMLLSIAVVAIGVALGLGVELVNRSALAEFDASLARINGEPDLSVRGATGSLDERMYSALLADPAVESASPVVDARAEIVGPDGLHRAEMPLIGIDPMRAATLSPALVARGQSPASLFSADSVFLSPAALESLAARIGSEVDVRVGAHAQAMRVAGTLDAIPGSQTLAVADVATVQWRFGWLGALTRIDLRLTPGADPRGLRERIDARQPGLVWVRPGDAERRMSNLSRAYRVNLTMLAMVALLTGAFLVHSNIAFAARRQWPEFALLQMLGASRRLVHAAVLGQGLAVGLIGALVGCAAGVGFASLLLASMGADFGAGYFGPLQAPLRLTPGTLAVFAALGVAAGVSGAWLPARAAARIAPAQAIRGAATDAKHSARRGWALPATLFALGAVALALPPLAELPVGAYAAIALWLLAAVARTDALVATIARALERRAGAVWPWPAAWLAVERTAHRPRGAGTAMAGVVASFALAAAMGIMVHSFRSSVSHWLDAVLPADLYARAPAQGPRAGLDPGLVARLARVPGVLALRTMRVLPMELDPARPAVALMARPIDAAAPYRSLPLTGSAREPDPGCTPVYGSEAMTDLYGWRIGARVVLPLGPTGHCFRVAGIWRDYARQHGAIAIDLDDYRKLSGDDRITDLAITSAPTRDRAALIDALIAADPRLGGLQWRTADQIRSLSIAIFDRSFAATYALEAVAILIGLLGVASGYATEALARTREFGVLQHLGLTRLRLASMLGLEAAITVGAGALLELGLGAALALILIDRVNPVSFHWTMDVAWPVGLLAGSAAALVTLASLTAAIVTYRAARVSPVRAVRTDW